MPSFWVTKTLEEMTRVAIKLNAFAGLSFAADTQDQAALSLDARVQQFLADMQNRTLFFNLWWKIVGNTQQHRARDASSHHAAAAVLLGVHRPYHTPLFQI